MKPRLPSTLGGLTAALIDGPRRRWPGVRARSAVAVVLRQGQLGPEVLLTRRNQRDGDPWSGHVALPGGRAEPADADLIATARRETREEVGLQLGQPVGGLDSLLTRTHDRWRPMTVEPWVFTLPRGALPSAVSEVRTVFWTPLLPLADGRLDTVRPWRVGPATLPMPAWQWQEHTIWGLTYQVLRDLLRRAECRG